MLLAMETMSKFCIYQYELGIFIKYQPCARQWTIGGYRYSQAVIVSTRLDSVSKVLQERNIVYVIYFSSRPLGRDRILPTVSQCQLGGGEYDILQA